MSFSCNILAMRGKINRINEENASHAADRSGVINQLLGVAWLG